MVSEKNIDPRKIIIMIISAILALILKNLIIGTLCIEEYQIAKCPNNLNLNSYYIQAENKEDANNQIKIILEKNNISLDDYEIKINNNIIKIIEKEKQETEKAEEAGTEKQETEETTTIQENNLEIKNESIEFENDNNEIILKSINLPVPDIFNIKFNDEKIDYTLSLQLREGQQIKLLFTEIQNAIDNNYTDEKVTWKLKDENGNELTGEEKLYDDIEKGTGVHNYTVDIIKETTEEGGTITNQDIKELKEISMCICVLLAIMFIYNFTNSMLKRY